MIIRSVAFRENGDNMKRFIHNSKFTRKPVKASASGGTVTLKDMNTSIIPVADFGCYGGPLSTILEDVFDYSFIDINDIDPNDDNYDEIVQLVNNEYIGSRDFYQQVLDLAPKTIQQAFDEYGIPATVVDGTCKWYHPRQYNFGDDEIVFAMTIDANWVESKFDEFSRDSKFIDFIKKEYSSRDGFISFMPSDVSEYDELLDPDNSDYWQVVSAVITYIVNSDTSIRESVMDDLYDYMISNPNYVSFSEFMIF
jgi:hypothetical protein